MNKKVCVGMREELHNFGHDALLPVLGKDNRNRAIWTQKVACVRLTIRSSYTRCLLSDNQEVNVTETQHRANSLNGGQCLTAVTLALAGCAVQLVLISCSASNTHQYQSID